MHPPRMCCRPELCFELAGVFTAFPRSHEVEGAALRQEGGIGGVQKEGSPQMESPDYAADNISLLIFCWITIMYVNL